MNAANAAYSESFNFSFCFGFRVCIKTGSYFKAYFNSGKIPDVIACLWRPWTELNAECHTITVTKSRKMATDAERVL